MAIDSTSLASKVQGMRDWCRPNLFNVTISKGVDSALLEATVSKASIPQYGNKNLSVSWMGRPIPVPGNSDFGNEVTISFPNDIALKLRKEFSKVINNLNETIENKTLESDVYSYTMEIAQLDGSFTPVYTVKLYDVLPVNISSMDFDSVTMSEISSTDVKFVYSWFEVVA